jgi:hypothetical protein
MSNREFRLPVATGKGVIMFQHAVNGYLPPTYSHAVERTKTPFHPIQVPAEGEIAPLTLKLARGLGVRGVVRDEEGKPVAGAPVRGANFDRHFLHGFTTTDADGKFTLTGLSPHADTMIVVALESGAAVHTVPGELEHPWDKTRWVAAELILAPGVALTGRVLKDGKPRSGVRMKISRSIGEEKNPLHPWVEVLTNAEGKYRVAGLAAGDRYWVEVQDSQGLMALDWQYQFPHIQTVPSDKAVVELPDAILVSRKQR